MAGLQFCYRKLLVVGTSRIICKNGILHQPNRGRHNFVFGVTFRQSSSILKKSKLNFNRQCLYRLASTNVTEVKEVLNDSQVPTAAANGNVLQNGSLPQSVTAESPSSGVVIDESSLPPIPSLEIETPVLEFVTTGLGEPSLRSLGLGSWYPSGMVQQVLEFIHVSFNMPWWAAIASLTLCLRLVTFPVTLSARRNTINMMNNMPQIAQYQMKITTARKEGDYMSAATHMQEFQTFIKEKNINMLAFAKPLLFQTPFFISMFWGLKGMADAPVESLKTQGLLWFTDLTASDPYYVLSALLAGSLYAVIWVGAEGVSLQSVSSNLVKLLLRGMPLVVFAVSTQFSTCIVWYWTISNLTVLIQTGLLKLPSVAKFLKVPKVIRHDPSIYKPPKKNFIADFKEGLSNAKITREIEERERLNTLTFEKAGSSSIPRTFKQNPKLMNASKAVENKA